MPAMFYLGGCKENYTPKPSAFYRIDTPESVYTLYSDNRFSFSVSDQAVVRKKASSTTTETWFNIIYPAYKAEIYCTYFAITPDKLPALFQENEKLIYSHTSHADAFQQITYEDSVNSKYGALYRIMGDVATPFQFYISDEKRNFLRGSLYFSHKVQRDSIAPILAVLEEDISELFNTLSWK